MPKTVITATMIVTRNTFLLVISILLVGFMLYDLLRGVISFFGLTIIFDAQTFALTLRQRCAVVATAGSQPEGPSE
jgi:hypothetical protein